MLQDCNGGSWPCMVQQFHNGGASGYQAHVPCSNAVIKLLIVGVELLIPSTHLWAAVTVVYISASEDDTESHVEKLIRYDPSH